jgi:alkylation response protein AidB-like acyl-CoA dehydrogenase
MQVYNPPTADFLFLLYDVFEIEKSNTPSFSDFTKDVVEPILTAAGKLASDVLSPINKIGDDEGCYLQDGSVRTPTGFKDAFKTMCDGGWPSINCAPKYGGQGIPLTISSCVGEIFASANISLFIYQALSHGVYSAILAHGTEEQKDTYLKNIATCKWTGTMNLTEPQCGTDLGLINTKAVRQQNGNFEITGQKIYISAGDHDLTENIIHLVLAKIPGSPDGMKGLSLFIVPKLIVNVNGELTKRNSLTIGKLENKMGIHGNATCVINYDGATGYLLGVENKGLRSMFTMMNEARLGVGIQGLAQAEIAYQNALLYAKDRLQGNSVKTEKSNHPVPEPIIVHPDIRRLLMEQKSFIEGGRAFTVWVSILIDKGNLTDDLDSKGLVSLLVPVVKAFLSDKGFESTIDAQQILGGHGYVEDYSLSQFARDCRIAMIYEGTNGIQALDLVGRKLSENSGRNIINLVRIIKGFIKDNQKNINLKNQFLNGLESSVNDLESSLQYFLENGTSDPESVLTGATDFLHLLGNVVLGFMWSKIALISFYKIENNNCNNDIYKSKLLTGRFYIERSLPETKLLLNRIISDKNLIMGLEKDLF